MKNVVKKTSLIITLTLLALPVYAQRLSDQPGMNQMQPQGQPSPEMQKLQQEFMGLNQQLQTIQQQAYQDPNIASETEKFTDLIDKKIIVENPDMKSSIEKRDALIDSMEKAHEKGDQETMQGLQQEFMQISQSLQPAMQKAMEDEKIKAMEEELKMKIFEKMKSINPDTEKIMARLEQIGREVESMQ